MHLSKSPVPAATHQAGAAKGRRAFAGCLVALAATLPFAAWAQKGIGTLQLDELKVEPAVVAQVYQADQLKPMLKGATKVAVAAFTLESVLKTGRGVQSGNTSLEVTYVLAEVPQAAVQAALDKAYQDFVADLKAAGLEVVAHEQVVATQAFKTSKQSASAPAQGPRRIEQGEFMVELYQPLGLNTTADSRWMYMMSLQNAGASPLMGAFRAIGNAAALASDGNLQLAIAKELGVPVITVALPMEFVEQRSSSSRSGVGVSSDLRLSLSPMGFVGVSSPEGRTAALPHSVYLAFAGTPVKEVKDTSSTGANAALGLLNAMVGQGRSKRMVEKTAVADPEQFPLAVAQGLARFRPILMQAVTAMRE